MLAPGDNRPTWRKGVIQIHITRACDQSCIGCTQGSNLAGKPVMMTTEQFYDACLSLRDYYGVIGIFGGNPTMHPDFSQICGIFASLIPYEQRGLWSNNLRGYGDLCRQIFNPAVSNLNVHMSQEAYDEMKTDWPECSPIGLEHDSRHSPPYVAMKDVGISREKQWELIQDCDINKYWSAMVCSFRGELRGFFCELAGAQSMLHQNEADYPDTGIRVYPGWWKQPIETFQHQIEKHCFECGIPLRGKGDLATTGNTEYVSETHKKIYVLKKPRNKEIRLVTEMNELDGSVPRATDYIQNGRLVEAKNNVKVLIAIPTAEFGRRADFRDYIDLLDRPEGTEMYTAHGSSPARQRNEMIRHAINGGFTHIMFFDDDMAPRPDIIKRLLAHDKDIVTGLYYMRNYPHTPIIFDYAFDNGMCKFHFMTDETKGLVEVVNTGLGCCLIKTSVFLEMINKGQALLTPAAKIRRQNEAINDDSITVSIDDYVWITLGEAEPDHWCDDVAFFNRARKAGFKLYCDTDCPVGHMATMIIWPNKTQDGKWMTVYDTQGAGTVMFPQVIPDNAEIEQQIMALGGRK